MQGFEAGVAVSPSAPDSDGYSSKSDNDDEINLSCDDGSYDSSSLYSTSGYTADDLMSVLDDDADKSSSADCPAKVATSPAA